MAYDNSTAELDDIPVARIRPNDDNPRLTFRQGELDELQESIRVYGVQVPISVYKESGDYILIDGERRWRCASKLNRKTIPALVQAKPSKLDNLLLMFNIHALREQWDLLTIALKLPEVIKQYRKEHKSEPNEGQLAEATGLARSAIRRCRLLMDLPDKYKSLLLDELKKPKTRQRLSEDFFIEMEKALKTMTRAMPNVIASVGEARDVLLAKYTNGVIKNIVDLRKIPKIAKAEKIGADADAAEAALKQLFEDRNFSIDAAFEQTVAEFYNERDILSRVEALITRLENIDEEALDDKLRKRLNELVKRTRLLLEG